MEFIPNIARDRNKYLDKLQSFCECMPPSVEECPDLYTELFLRSLTMNNDVFPVIDDDMNVEFHASTPDDVSCLN